MLAIMPNLVRVWEKVRWPLVQQWLVTVERSYVWAREGRTAEDVVWLQLVEGEAMHTGRGPQHDVMLALLLDLAKCFNNARRCHVWRWGGRD